MNRLITPLAHPLVDIHVIGMHFSHKLNTMVAVGGNKIFDPRSNDYKTTLESGIYFNINRFSKQFKAGALGGIPSFPLRNKLPLQQKKEPEIRLGNRKKDLIDLEPLIDAFGMYVIYVCFLFSICCICYFLFLCCVRVNVQSILTAITMPLKAVNQDVIIRYTGGNVVLIIRGDPSAGKTTALKLVQQIYGLDPNKSVLSINDWNTSSLQQIAQNFPGIVLMLSYYLVSVFFINFFVL